MYTFEQLWLARIRGLLNNTQWLDDIIEYVNGMHVDPQPPIPLKLQELPVHRKYRLGPATGPTKRKKKP